MSLVSIENAVKCPQCGSERAWKGNAEKDQALNKMFEFLEPFAQRPIGKRFGLDYLYYLKQKIIKASLSNADEEA